MEELPTAEAEKAKRYVEESLLETISSKLDQVILQADQSIDQLQKNLTQITQQRIALHGQKSIIADLLKQAKYLP